MTWYESNKERALANTRDWRRQNPEKFKAAQRRNEKRRQEAVDERRNAHLARQGGVCAICCTDDPGTRLGWHLDHDHSCCPGRPSGDCDRGVLCQTCNGMVVAVLDNYLDRIIPAMNYLNLTWQDVTGAHSDD